MRKILFLTTRNIVTTCGELRLIKNRAKTLYEEYGYKTDFLALVTRKDKSKIEPMGFDSSLKYFEYTIKNPLGYIKAKKAFVTEIKDKLANENYDLVVISGGLAFGYIKLVKKLCPNLRVFADIHGASAEELIEFKPNGLVKKLRAKLLIALFDYNEKKYLPLYDDYFAVSKGLEEYLYKKYKITGNTHIVPCAAAVDEIDVDFIQKSRLRARKKYGVKDDEILFIYSGGVSPWQCISQTVEIFNQIKQADMHNKCKLLILSGNLDYIKKYEKAGVIMVDTLPATLVPSTIPAADYAFLLREDYITNNVAYPNKFLEYVAAGTKIIATPFVYDVAEQIKQYDLGYLLKDVCFTAELSDYCFKGYKFGSDIEARNQLLKDISFKNRLSFLK